MRSTAKPAALWLVLVMWTLLYYEPHYLVSGLIGGGAVFQRIPIFLLIPLALVLIQTDLKRALYWPLTAFVAFHLVMVPFAYNRGLAMVGFKGLLLFYLPFVVTLGIVRTPKSTLTLFKLFLFSFPWYCVQGLPHGLVWWHTELANPDALGPLGVMAIPLGYYTGLGASERKWRLIGFGIAVLGAVAMVASFARGAFLAGVVVLFAIWLRSPHKLATLGWGVAALGVIAVAAQVLFPRGAFWSEMSTILEGTSNEEDTGHQRWQLWTIVGWEVFKTSPILGVGAWCTGAVGASIIPDGTLSGNLADSSTLYDKAIHNNYVQLVAEQGILGSAIWFYMVYDFFRRMRRIRKRTPRMIWNQAIGGRFDLLHVSLGLECAMIGFLVGAIFYNQVYVHWFYTLLLFALLFTETTRPRRSRAGAQPATGSAQSTGRVTNRALLSRVQITSRSGA